MRNLEMERVATALLAFGLLNAGNVIAGTATVRPNSPVVIVCPERSFEAESDARGVVEVPDGCTVTDPASPAAHSAIITVTATRTPVRLGESAASVVVLSRRELDVSPVGGVDEALRQVPGFTLFRRSTSRTANPTSQGVSLRGVGASGASRALVLDDGVPLNDPFGGWVYWNRVPRVAVDRVEILRGGASDLYGSSSFGGVINVLRRETTVPALLLDASWGQQSTFSTSLFGALHSGDWSGSAALDLFRTGGYVSVAPRQRGAVDSEVASRHELLEATLEHGFAHGRLFARTTRFTEDRENGTPLQSNATDGWQWSGGGEWSSTLIGAASARLWVAQQSYDQTFSSIAVSRATERLTRSQQVRTRSYGASTQTIRAFGGRNVAVAGLELRRVDGTNDEEVFAGSTSKAIVSARQDLAGLFLEDIFSATPRLTLSAGGRLDLWRNADARFADASGTGRFPDRSESSFSPRLTGRYELRSGVATFASAYRAFRSPTLNELYRSFRVGNVLTLANADLSAEVVRGAEWGFSFASHDGRKSARAVLFVADVDSPVANVTLSSTPSLVTRQRKNLGATRTRGIELDAERRLGAVTLDAAYLWSDARVRDFAADRTLEGNLLPQTPRQQASLSLRYDTARRGNYALTTRWSERQFEDDQNLLPLERYVVSDLFASWPVYGPSSLYVAADNAFDRRYSIGLAGVRTLASPRTISLGLRIRAVASKR